MPIYEYRCLQCGHVQEELVNPSTKPERTAFMLCNECKHISKRIISVSHFRVTGFNSKNGYNLPLYGDVIDQNGFTKKEWKK